MEDLNPLDQYMLQYYSNNLMGIVTSNAPAMDLDQDAASGWYAGFEEAKDTSQLPTCTHSNKQLLVLL
eukprot:10277276-Prorocentrum_lima.AAC.1